ncbi:matrixin family metalloprotease [Paludisphaera rhizosphaerae]|uniref:matrixin family metalloprotease n=1 Tax=Paludisphaera rhizosphaerae TaxID=2711216 RepID=UPI0013EC1A0C|nr:matrixin family metalloprotease [Paludisphaera rhizosphaerae]
MMRQSQDQSREGSSGTANRRWRPRVEGLEERLLLYATLGANWTYGSRITYSFVPDGTAIGVNSSSLFQTLNSLGSSDVWQREFASAAAVWQAVANINLVQVSDNGAPLGSAGNQQGSPYFGDIRISAMPLSSGTLGAAYSPPPLNGGTLAGDIVLNSNVSWKIDANYDLQTVAIHELGHALGMDHSTIAKAVMYYYYTGIKQSLNSDDIAGIDSISAYGPRQYDSYNSGGQNNQIWYNAKSLDKYRTSLNQITQTDLDITTSTMTEWFWVTIPQTNIGSFTVTAQSKNLSLLAPQVMVFDSSLNYLGVDSGAALGTGSTATLSVGGVTAGQGFFIRVASAGGDSGGTGAYALQINFGTSKMALVAPPNTAIAAQSSQGGGITQMTTSAGPVAPSNSTTSIGSAAAAVQSWLASVLGQDHDHHGVLQLGGLSAVGDELLAGPTLTVHPQALSESMSFDPSGMRTGFSAAADAMRLTTPTSAFANASDGNSTSTVSIDHALAGWNIDWNMNKYSRTRRSTWLS